MLLAWSPDETAAIIETVIVTRMKTFDPCQRRLSTIHEGTRNPNLILELEVCLLVGVLCFHVQKVNHGDQQKRN